MRSTSVTTVIKKEDGDEPSPDPYDSREDIKRLRKNERESHSNTTKDEQAKNYEPPRSKLEEMDALDQIHLTAYRKADPPDSVRRIPN